MTDERHTRMLWLLLLIAAVVILAGAGLRDPWPADEPRFVGIAKEMVDSGDWFFPMRGGELYPDKPPVFMWSLAVLYALTRSLAATFLIPSALASLLNFYCVVDIATKLWNKKAALNAGLLMLIVPQFMMQAKTAQIDAMVACWITVAMYGLLRHFFYKPSLGWYFLSWAFMGLGIITKGVGFLPLLFLIPVLILHFSGKHTFEYGQMGKHLLLGPVALLLVLAAWLIPMLYIANTSDNPDFLVYRDNILFKQMGERYANSWGHIKPWYYFLMSVIPLLWFPLYAFLFSRAFWKDIKASPVMVSLLTWVVLVVIFFSVSPGKRGLYILPALPMMALVVGAHISNVGIKPWFRRVLATGSIAIGLLFLVVAVLCFTGSQVVEAVGDRSVVFGLFFLGLSLVWFAIFIWKRNSMNLYALCAAFAVTWVVYSTGGYALLNPIRTPAKAMMSSVQNEIEPNGELGLTRFKEQFLLFTRSSLVHFGYGGSKSEQDRNSWMWMSEKSNRFVMTVDDGSIVCFDVSLAVQLGVAHRRNWILLNEDTMLPTCDLPETVKRYHLPMKVRY